MGHGPPRMPVSYQQKLQMHPSLRVGDWFILKEFIVIRIYVFELEPYQLPIYIPPILFSLEYCRQILMTDQFHFVSKNKKSYFSLPAEVSSFLIKSRSYIDYINKFLTSYHLKNDISCNFYPYHVIFKHGKNVGLPVYQHCPNIAIEMIANKNTWQEVKNVLIMKNSNIKTNMETKLQAKIVVTIGAEFHSLDPKCMITGEKRLTNNNELGTDLSSMRVEENGANNLEEREIKRRKLLDTVNQEVEEVQNDIS